MNPPIKQVLTAVEGKTLEFKRNLSSPRNILKTLVAFANSAGGQLLIGVDDDRQIIGVERPLDEEERLCNLIADSISPHLVPNVEIMTHEGKSLLLVETFPSSSRPHYLKNEGHEKGVYVRLGSSNRQASPELVAELRRSTTGVAFDEQPMPALSIADLDIEAAQRLFGPEHPLTEEALLTLRLLVREQGRLVPTKGAILLFGKHREQHFPDAWVQCGRFIGTDKARIFDHTEIHAHLPNCVEEIMGFLKKHAIRGADFSEVQRKDVWSIPLLILREAVINALVHADYSHQGAPIRVAFFDDRIEVENPGILVPGMTVEAMKRGVSNLRNRVIARVFRELKLIEQWGSGVSRIFREAEEQGLPEPAIEEIGLHLRLTVFLASPLATDSGNAASTEQLGQTIRAGLESEVRPESRLETGLESRLESELAARVVLLLTAQTASKAELAQLLGHKTISGALNRQIRALLEQDIIEMTLPDKPSSRFQQYRLTEQGRALIAKLKETPK